MKCIALPLTTPVSDWAEVALANSRALDELLAGERLVQTADDVVPGQRLEEGMPVRWGDKAERVPLLPHGDDAACEVGTFSA